MRIPTRDRLPSPPLHEPTLPVVATAGVHRALGVGAERIYVDHGLTGTNRERPASAKRWLPAGPATRSW